MKKVSIIAMLIMMIVVFKVDASAQNSELNEPPIYSPLTEASPDAEESTNRTENESESENENKDPPKTFLLTIVLGGIVICSVGIIGGKLIKDMSTLNKKVTDIYDMSNALRDINDLAVKEQTGYQNIDKEKEWFHSRLEQLEAVNRELTDSIKKYCERFDKLSEQFDNMSRQSDKQMKAAGENSLSAEKQEKERQTYSLEMHNGSVKLCEGNYVYVEADGENRLKVYPSQQAQKKSVRNALINFFDFEGGGSAINLIKPCILEKTSMNYSITQKGKVRLV